jgi:hypothetical protein
LTHGIGSEPLITTASAEWVPLSMIYHYVLNKSASPEAAKIAISVARKRGQLRLRASEVSEHESKPELQLHRGEEPPKIQPKRSFNELITTSDEFRQFDWERSYATKRDSSSGSLFEYVGIVGYRDDVLRHWPPTETTSKPTDGAPGKPAEVTGLVWAVVRTLDRIEREDATRLAGLTQKMLTRRVSEQLSRPVSIRTLQKAVAFRRKTNQLR